MAPTRFAMQPCSRLIGLAAFHQSAKILSGAGACPGFELASFSKAQLFQLGWSRHSRHLGDYIL